MKLPGYTRCRRLYGYVSEIMLPLYCEYNGLKVRYEEWVPMVGDQAPSHQIKRAVIEMAKKGLYRLWKDEGIPDLAALRDGLKADQIMI